MVADLHTRQVDIALRVPPAVFADAQTAIETMILRQTSSPPTDTQDHQLNTLILAQIRCLHEKIGGKSCYKCRRYPRAA